jgi:hypothetical protein
VETAVRDWNFKTCLCIVPTGFIPVVYGSLRAVVSDTLYSDFKLCNNKISKFSYL